MVILCIIVYVTKKIKKNLGYRFLPIMVKCLNIGGKYRYTDISVDL